MNTYDDPYNLFPASHYVAKLVHLHPGNSTEKQRGNGSPYKSILKVWKKGNSTELNSEPDMTLTARCRKGDTPSRSVARMVLRQKAQAVKEALGWP